MEGLFHSVHPLSIFIDEKLLFYKVNSKHSMSGSPIIVKNNKVIGLHKFNHKLANNCKGARLITTDMIDRLQNWAE